MAVEHGEQTRVPLTTARIVGAAIALADSRGLDALSMRTLATELDAAPMALYRHVAGKEALIDHMVDVVFGEMAFPERGPEWRHSMRERAFSARSALRRHPWAIGLMESREQLGQSSLAHRNATLGCLRRAGFSFPAAVHAYSLLDSYTYGFALQEKTIPFDTPEESAEVATKLLGSLGATYPYLAEVAVELNRSGFDYDTEFAFGLDLILDGLERFLKTDRAR